MRGLLAVVLLLAAGCATTRSPRSRFRLIEQSFGIYEIRGQETELLSETTEIPCELGVAFGVPITLELSSASGGELPLAGELSAPLVEGVRPAIKRIAPTPFVLPPGMRSAPLPAGYSSDKPEERVPGSDSIRFQNPDTDRVIDQRAFRGSACRRDAPSGDQRPLR